MTMKRFALLSSIAAVALHVIPGWALPAEASSRCKALAASDFSGIVDAPTQITDARVVQSFPELAGNLTDGWPPELLARLVKSIEPMQPVCKVSGYVAPQVGFMLLLPTSNWNGKFLHMGCGGWCGTTVVAVLCALHPNYACVSTDMGHTAGIAADGLWFRNNLQAQIDFSYRATHVATLASKAIVEQYYAQAPHKSYFMGCSTGGYQAMVEAQRFPWDFDGIIAGDADMDEYDSAVHGIWLKRSFFDEMGQPVLDSAAIELIHRAALEKCDMDDGVKDGIISDPVHCSFDPAVLQCSPVRDKGCLSAAQAKAAKNIYGVPKTSKGLALSTRGVFPGSELLWNYGFKTGDWFFKDTYLLSVPGKDWSYRDFDFDRDYRRAGGVLFVATNPDLRQFKAAGGKLISYHGGNDTLVNPGASIDYYETVEKTMGGRAATQDFFRLFVVPGMNHCTGGNGVFELNYLGYLEAWVEQGRAPDVMIGVHIKGAERFGGLLKHPLDPSVPISFTRPVYPYPMHAVYKGTGDPSKGENFKPVGPRS